MAERDSYSCIKHNIFQAATARLGVWWKKYWLHFAFLSDFFFLYGSFSILIYNSCAWRTLIRTHKNFFFVFIWLIIFKIENVRKINFSSSFLNEKKHISIGNEQIKRSNVKELFSSSQYINKCRHSHESLCQFNCRY